MLTGNNGIVNPNIDLLDKAVEKLLLARKNAVEAKSGAYPVARSLLDAIYDGIEELREAAESLEAAAVEYCVQHNI